MIHDPPRTAIVTAKTYQKQPGNKITGLAGILLPVLLPVFFLKTNQVTGGNENDWLSRHLNAREICLRFYTKSPDFVRCLLFILVTLLPLDIDICF